MTYFNDKRTGDRKWIAGDEEHEEALAECGVSVEAAWRVRGRPVRWLVENVIPHDAVTVIAGEPGAGKTFFACQLAADAARVSQCRVVLATSGHEPPELLRWRLDQADADTRRVALATLSPNGVNDRRGGPTAETIDERMALLYHTLLGAGDPTSGILPVEGSGSYTQRVPGVQGSQSPEGAPFQGSGEDRETERGSERETEGRSEGETERGSKGQTEGIANCKLQNANCKLGQEDGDNPTSKIQNPKSAPELPRAAELLVIDDVDGWFGKPGQCVSAADLARVIQRLSVLARELHVAIVVLVRAQMSAEGRITSRQLSRLAQSASVVWMVVKDREQGTGPRAQGQKETGSEWEREGRSEEEIEGIAKCKMQNDASGSRPDSEDLNPKTQDLRPKTSDFNPKSKIENPKSADDGQRTTDMRAYSQSVRRWFLPVKNNLAADVQTFGRAFELFDGQIRWHADDEAPSLAEATPPSAHNNDRRRLRQAAAVWLQEALAAGPLPSKELYRQGVENGFSQGTLKRAATELGILPHKSGFNGGWEMRWTPPPVVRGRGTTAGRADAGFKIFAGDHGGGDGGMEGPRDGATEQESGQWAVDSGQQAETGASCASSAKCEEFEAASCASSTEHRESCVASCASSTEPDGIANCKMQNANCKLKEADAPNPDLEPRPYSQGTVENQTLKTQVLRPTLSGPNPKSKIDNPKSRMASCASSMEPDGIANCKMQIANCKLKEADAPNPDLEPRPYLQGTVENQTPKTQDLKPKTSDSKSDGGCNIYAVIADALQEACFQKAC